MCLPTTAGRLKESMNLSHTQTSCRNISVKLPLRLARLFLPESRDERDVGNRSTAEKRTLTTIFWL